MIGGGGTIPDKLYEKEKGCRRKQDYDSHERG